MRNDAAQGNHGRSGFRRDSDMRKHLLKLATLLSVALAVALFAPQHAAADDDDDPPSRVARLSYANGTVSFNPDRKSTRLNSSHGYISYAVFCLKKKKPSRAARSMSPRG